MNKHQYIEYLIATLGNYTCTNLAEHLEGEHAAISDYLRRECLTARMGCGRSLRQCCLPTHPIHTYSSTSGVQDKRYSQKIALVRWQYSGAAHGLLCGIGIINLVRTTRTDSEFFPVDYLIYDPDADGKTKNEHFREMFVYAIAENRSPRAVLFDSWYASVENLKLIHRADFFSRPRRATGW